MNSMQLSQFIAFAATKHRHQKRKGNGLPFIVHPLSVMQRIIDTGLTDTVIFAVAVGHDLIEDTGATVAQIKGFLTDSGVHPKEADWIASRIYELSNIKERKLKDTVDYFGRMSQESLLVKVCDAIDNITDTIESGAAQERHYIKYVEYFNLLKEHVNDSKYRSIIDVARDSLSSIIDNLYANLYEGAAND